MKKASLRSGIVLAGAVLLLAGCRQNATTPSSGQATSDSALTSQIEAKLYQDPVLKTRAIHVNVQRGVATLTGTVSADSEKAGAETLVSSISGVKQTLDLLAVSPAGTLPGPSSNKSGPGKQTAVNTPPKTLKAPSRPQTVANKRIEKPPKRKPPIQVAQQQTPRLPTVVEEPPPPPTETKPDKVNAPPPPPPPPPPPIPLTIPAGTDIAVTMIDSIDSATSEVGQTFAASVASPVEVGNQLVIPQGASARVRLEDDQRAGHFRGRPLLKVELVSITANGTTYNVETDAVERKGSSRGKNSAEKIGGGAGIGAIIGAFAYGKKGAGIGAGIGAGTGVAVQRLTHAKRVKIAAEQRLDFTLRSPLTVQVSAAGSANR